MASEIGALRLHLSDAFVEGDLASERVTFMNRVGCQVFRCTPEQAKTLHARDLFVAGEYERVNDTQGHDEGDRVLQAFAHFLARHHRSEDILIRLGVTISRDEDGDAS